jgi:hypothetical protein
LKARLDDALPLSEYLVAQLASKPTSAMPTARRTSWRWRGRCWRRSHPASIASCCSIGSPQAIGLSAERLQQWLAVPDRPGTAPPSQRNAGRGRVTRRDGTRSAAAAW